MSDCTLCELPADPPVTDEAVEGTFCCRGCLEVYRRLGDVDVAEEGGVSAAIDGSGDARDATPEGKNGIAVPEEAETAYLAVDGMHCSTCEVFLETVARDHGGIHDADASYATEAIKLVYDPAEVGQEELPGVVSGMGYTASARGENGAGGTDLASRLLVGGIFGMMAMTWYALFLYPTYFGFDPIVSLGQFDGAYLYSQLAVVTAIILLYTGQPILRGAYVSLRTRRPNVDLLVTVAAVSAYLYSTGQVLLGGTDLYYDVTIVVIMAVTVGTYYETRIKRATAGLLADLTELQVGEATRRGGETIPVSAIDPGDELLVRPGERIPVDGTVVEGRAAVDEALVTGESIPETNAPGDEVRGGTIVTDKPLVIEAGEGAQSTLDRIVDLLWEIQATRSSTQRIADRLATIFVPLVLSVAAVVTGGLLATGASVQTALLVGLTVVIVSCPCALGLATPLAVASGLQSAADRGVVIATPALFEAADEIETVVFDKTGTLTAGEMAVSTVVTDGEDERRVLDRAAAVERYSDHPIAEAIVAAADSVAQDSEMRDGATQTGRTAEKRADDSQSCGPSTVGDGGLAAPVGEFEQHARGVAGAVGGDSVLVGHPDLLSEQGWRVPDELETSARELRESGDVPVLVGWEGQVRGAIGVGDSPRSAWESVVETVGEDREVVVLTGDEGADTERLRAHPAVETVFAGVPPDGKAETIRRLAATSSVAMVGDGSNDAPALAAADVGVALESGTQLATDAADAIVLEGDLQNVPAVFDIASRTNRRIKENVAWAFCYNGVAIPLAVTGFLNPLFAAVAMATSSLLVVANSARTPGRDDSSVDGPDPDPDTDTDTDPVGDDAPSSSSSAVPQS